MDTDTCAVGYTGTHERSFVALCDFDANLYRHEHLFTGTHMYAVSADDDIHTDVYSCSRNKHPDTDRHELMDAVADIHRDANADGNTDTHKAADQHAYGRKHALCIYSSRDVSNGRVLYRDV